MNVLQLAIAFFVVANTTYAQEPMDAAPATIDAPQGATMVLQARGEGFQIYGCQADGTWKLKAPDATLFDAGHHALGIHFAGPRWRLDDGSEIQGKMLKSEAHPGTIPWLLLSATSTGHDGQLSHVDVVRRTDTEGGVAPAGGCDAAHTGAEQRVAYSATYSFYTTKN